MNKIGIKITKISVGVQELETFNGGEWTLKVADIRDDLKLLEGKAFDDGTSVLMLSFTGKGALLTLCHAIPGRAGDLVSAWIFIPAEVSLAADEVCGILERVNAEISKPQVEDWKAIEELFAREYPLKQYPFAYKESASSGQCAVRYYGTGTDFGLKELMGAALYQDYYTAHRFVFFLDKKTGITASDKLVDYTDRPLREIVAVIPSQLPPSVTAKLNDRDFSKPMLGYKGEKATLVFERPGFAPVAYQITIGGPMPNPAEFQWQRHIVPSFFHVTDNEGRDLNASCSILVNGQRLTGTGINIPEEESKSVRVEVHCPDCESYGNTLNLMQKQPVCLVLEKEKKEIVYLIDGMVCQGLTDCPKGYSFTETTRGKKVFRNCVYVGEKAGFNWKLIAIIGSACALIIGLTAGMLLHKILTDSDSKTIEQTSVVTGNGEPKTEAPVQVGAKPAETPQPKGQEDLNKDTEKGAEKENVPEQKPASGSKPAPSQGNPASQAGSKGSSQSEL
jgi:hypothetical protein